MSSVALETDLYQLTMAAGYFHRGMAATRASCEMFVRRLPPVRRYLVACGIEQVIAALAGLRFEEEDIAHLRSLGALADAMDEAFVAYLRDFRFRGDVWAVPEGTVVFAGEPLIRVEAPIIEAQIIETFLLSTVNHGTMIASKAARIVQAARGAAVLEFGTRRTHPRAAVDVARAAYLAGAKGTSNVEAGRRWAIPVAGTAAHMWTMTHDSEEEAFEGYVATFPNASILLIDTYDTLRGAERAARIAGPLLQGVRLDSGDLLELSKAVRRALDDAGCHEATIVASGDLNEYEIARLLDAGAPIDVFGVGTELSCSKDAPSLGGVYKVVQFERDGRVVPVGKLSQGKATYPGAKQIHRRFDADGRTPLGDLLTLVDEPGPVGSRPLLQRVMAAGERVGPGIDLRAARQQLREQLATLPESLHSIEPSDVPCYEVAISPGIEALMQRIASTQG